MGKRKKAYVEDRWKVEDRVKYRREDRHNMGVPKNWYKQQRHDEKSVGKVMGITKGIRNRVGIRKKEENKKDVPEIKVGYKKNGREHMHNMGHQKLA